MSERLRASQNVNDSKNTRLDIAGEFSKYRFGRDQLAHVSRYLFIVERMIELARKLGRPLKVLDIGCGDVYLVRVLVSSFVVKKTDVISVYVGFDIDDKRLEKTAQTVPNCVPIDLICGDVTNEGLAQFENGLFDLVVCTEVIEHIKPEFVPLLLNEVRRIGNKAIISTPNITGGTGKIPQDHIKEWDCEELTELMMQNGLQVNQRIGIFCNLSHVKRLCKTDAKLRSIFEFLEPRMDSDFLSICFARFIGPEAQNIMYLCDCIK